MSLFKRAAVRGVAAELVRRGVCEFPTKEAMDAAADAIADGPQAEALPETSGDEGHSPEQLAEVANKLIEIAHALMAEAQGAGAAAGAGGPEAIAQGAQEVKTSSARDLETLASEAALSVMDKAAEEVKAAQKDPKLVGGGGDHKNTPAAAAENDSVAALDQKNRPQGKYQVARGDSALNAAGGAIGEHKKNPVQPSNSPGGSNSLNPEKKAALQAEIAKIANKLVGLHDGKSNTLADAAAHDPVAALDQKNRPEGKYKVAPGGANFSEPQASRVGVEKKPDVMPSNSPKGTNSVIEASKAASLTDEQAAYVEEFKKTAADVGEYLPAGMTDEEKVAAINEMVTLDHAGREAYLQNLHKTASEKGCADGKCGNCAKCKASVGKEVPVEAKKESALLEQVRQIAASVGTK